MKRIPALSNGVLALALRRPLLMAVVSLAAPEPCLDHPEPTACRYARRGYAEAKMA